LLILDEPTNGLDIPSKLQFRKLVATHACTSNAMIISTHQVHDIEHLVDGIVILEQGKILLQASIEDITKALQVEQCATLPDTGYLYYEKKMQGYQVLTLNAMKKETHIDLEILFNAVLSNHPEDFSTFLRGLS
jgi:ABC-2 type transport system ATP-binding protein